MKQGTNKWMLDLRKKLGEESVMGENIIKTSEEIRERVKEWDMNEWRREMSERESLQMYREWRNEIGKQKGVYDNKQASVLLFKCRTNTLNINDRRRFKEEGTECQVCGNEKEDLPHFILWCPAYEEPRKKNKILQQPYEDDQEKNIGKFLFEENIREAKETLYQFWKIREKCTEK